MPVLLTVGTLIQKARFTGFLGLALMLSLSGLATAGLNVGKEDVELARKAQSTIAKQIETLENEKIAVDKEFKEASAKAIASKARLDEVEKTLESAQAEIDELTKKKPAVDKDADEAAAALKRLEDEVKALKEKEKALEKEAKGASIGNIRFGNIASYSNLPVVDGFVVKANELAGVELVNVQDEAKADDDSEPGFWRKRALKKGAEPKTAGEKKWVAEFMNEKANAEKAKSQEAAKEAAEDQAKAKAKQEAELAKKKAKAEAAAKEMAEEQAEAEAEKAEAQAKAEAKKNAAANKQAEAAAKKKADEEKAKAKAEAKKNAAANKQAEAAAEKKADEEKAKAKAEAKKKAEADKLAKEAAKKKAKEAAAAQEAQANDAAEPGFWRQRALKAGDKPATTGEAKWQTKYLADQKAATETKAKADAEKKARLEAEAIAEAEANKAKNAADELRRQEKIRVALEKKRLESEKKRRKDEARKEALAKKLETEESRRVRASQAKLELGKLATLLRGKEEELKKAQLGAEVTAKAKRETEEGLKRLEKVLKQAKKSVDGDRDDYAEMKAIADEFKDQVETKAGVIANLKNDLEAQKAIVADLTKKYQEGYTLLSAAESARFRYLSAVEKTEQLQSDLLTYTANAAKFQSEIPVVKMEVENATTAAVDAREVYESHKVKMHGATKSSNKLRDEIIIIDVREEKSNADENPLLLEVEKAVANLRDAEKRAKYIYQQADYNAYKARTTKRQIERNKKNLVSFKGVFDSAVAELQPWGSLDPVPEKSKEVKKAEKAAEEASQKAVR